MNKSMTTIHPVVCPKCGNTTEQDGIKFRYLEWCTVTVRGVIRNLASLDFKSFDYEDVHETASVQNVPSKTKNCQHFNCCKCNWNWYEDHLLLNEDYI